MDELVTISVHNLSCVLHEKDINNSKRKKGDKPESITLLENVTCTMRPHEMTALMGPSGAGKSSMLDILAGLKNTGEITGDILFNGVPRPRDFRQMCGYVEQRDTLLPTLTVREILYYTARLRLPADSEEEFLRQRVAGIIEELCLGECADTIIGSQSVRGISGGEAKRCNIAIEIVTDPRILFLDEPTTGLDSAIALDVIKVIREMTNRNRTVICTIHQPSQEIYSMFDKLLLLVGGKVVYNGGSDKAVEYFESLKFKRPRRMSAPEYFLNVCSDDNDRLVKEYSKSAMYSDRLASSVNRLGESVQISPEQSTHHLCVNSRWHNFKVLFLRTSVQRVRDRSFFFSRFGKTGIMMLMLCTVFVGQEKDFNSIYNIYSVLNFTVMNLTFGSLIFMGSLINERRFFRRERIAGSYQTSAYYFGIWLAELPYVVLQVFLFSLVYFAVGLTLEPCNYFTYVLIAIILADISSGLSMTFASVGKDYRSAHSMAMPVIMLSFLFAGFYVRRSEIPVWWEWAYYLSFLSYGFNALAINQFGGTDGWTRPACKGCDDEVPWTSQQVLNFWGTGSAGAIDTLWGNVATLALFWVFWRTLPFLGLKYMNNVKR